MPMRVQWVVVEVGGGGMELLVVVEKFARGSCDGRYDG
jgi:hypothetical protein